MIFGRVGPNSRCVAGPQPFQRRSMGAFGCVRRLRGTSTLLDPARVSGSYCRAKSSAEAASESRSPQVLKRVKLTIRRCLCEACCPTAMATWGEQRRLIVALRMYSGERCARACACSGGTPVGSHACCSTAPARPSASSCRCGLPVHCGADPSSGCACMQLFVEQLPGLPQLKAEPVTS